MERRRSLFLWLTAAVVLCFGPTYAQQSSPNFSELEKVAVDELHQLNTPGAAIGIVSGDRLIYAKGIGISNIETGTPVTPTYRTFRTPDMTLCRNCTSTHAKPQLLIRPGVAAILLS